jgi:hypothetical protein
MSPSGSVGGRKKERERKKSTPEPTTDPSDSEREIEKETSSSYEEREREREPFLLKTVKRRTTGSLRCRGQGKNLVIDDDDDE